MGSRRVLRPFGELLVSELASEVKLYTKSSERLCTIGMSMPDGVMLSSRRCSQETNQVGKYVGKEFAGGDQPARG